MRPFACEADLGSHALNDRPNSLAARDIAYYFHPATNARRHEQVGPMMIERGEGIYVFDDQGKQYIEGLAGLWSVAVGFGEPRLVKAAARADGQAAFLSLLLAQIASRRDQARRAAGRDGARHGESAFHLVGVGGQRPHDEDDLVLQQRARPSAEEEDHRPSEGLSRRHHRLGEPTGPAQFPSRFRSAAADGQARLLPQSLALRQARRERGGFLDPPRRGTRGHDPARKGRTRSPPSSASRSWAPAA